MTIRFMGVPGGFAIGAFVSGVGNILVGTKLRFYDTGGSTPRAVYSDAGLTTPITQPIVADSAGRWCTDGNGNTVNDIFLQSGLYKLAWETAAGAEIKTWDNVDPGLATGGSAGILAVAEGGTGANTAAGARSNLGAAATSALDTEVSARQALDARVVVLEGAASFIQPGHRLTLTSATPVLPSDVTGASTIYLTPWLHNRISLWDGSQWTLAEFDEVSQALSDATKSPAAAGTSSAYDLFAWLDGATPRCTRGPAWSSVTSRGTGAGTTELEQIDGVWVNKINISNGPEARKGRYMGSIVTDGSTQLSMMFAPTPAAGGTANRLDVWNMYNRVDVASLCRDSTNSWDYTTATIRSANAAAASGVAQRITFMRGMNEDKINAAYHAVVGQDGGFAVKAGIGLDATDAFHGLPGTTAGDSDLARPRSLIGVYRGLPGLGQHFVNANEYSEASGTTRWFGDNNAPTLTQSGLTFEGRM